MRTTSNRPEPRHRQQDDVGMLVALASAFYLFRQFEKSFAIISLAEHIEPSRHDTLELKAVLLCEMYRFEDALEVIAQIEILRLGMSDELLTFKRRAAANID